MEYKNLFELKTNYIIFVYLFNLIFFFVSSLKSEERILITSIPKSGTHLIAKVVEKITGKIGKTEFHVDINQTDLDKLKQNEILVTHIMYSKPNQNILTKNHIKTFFIYRDPRDEIVSFAYYCKANPGLWPSLYKFSINELIFILTLNYYSAYFDLKVFDLPHLRTVDDFFRKAYLPWREDGMVYTTKFEDLVGTQGGGSAETQKREIKNIANYLNISLNEKQINNIAQNIFGNSSTFREGKIGKWKEHFTESHKRIFKIFAGQLLIDLGYEKDLSW